MTYELPDEVLDAAIEAAYKAEDARNHENLCFCIGWPESCETYGTLRPWSYDEDSFARAAIRALSLPPQTTTSTEEA